MKTKTNSAKGKIYKMSENIDTDQIIASQYLQIASINEMKKFTFATILPDFVKIATESCIISAGKNFGCGSSREQAPAVLKALGVKAVIADSFARIFFRNSLNIGLPLIICPGFNEIIEHNSKIEINFSKGCITSNKSRFSFIKYPSYLQNIVNSGGLINMINGESHG